MSATFRPRLKCEIIDCNLQKTVGTAGVLLRPRGRVRCAIRKLFLVLRLVLSSREAHAAINGLVTHAARP